MTPIINVLANNPILLIFLVCGIGYALGSIPFGKNKIKVGAAMVLFVGLAFGALSPKLALPPLVDGIGLVLLMYTVGLQASSGFFNALTNRRGLKELIGGLIVIGVAAVITIFASRWIPETGGYKAAVFSGIMSNSTGLAAIINGLTELGRTGKALQVPVVAFSLTYPSSYLAPVIVMLLAPHFFKVNLQDEAKNDSDYQASHVSLESATIRITQPNAIHRRLDSLLLALGNPKVVLGTLYRKNRPELFATSLTALELEDRIQIVSTVEVIQMLQKAWGEIDSNFPPPEFESHRVFLSNPKMAGIPLDRLHLQQNLGLKITRVRRGDTEFVPDPHTRLELGDRLRILAMSNSATRITNAFGDSISVLSEIDYLSFGLGIALGILLGLIPIPLPGGNVLRMGIAGGPLISGLVLGKFDRTKNIVWRLPYASNKLLQQLGIMLFSVGLGTRSGFAFYQSLIHGNGIQMAALGFILTLILGVITLFISFKILKVNLNRSFGIFAGALTQPIVLDFVEGFTNNEIASTPYATLFPFCIIVKIIMCQALLILLK